MRGGEDKGREEKRSFEWHCMKRVLTSKVRLFSVCVRVCVRVRARERHRGLLEKVFEVEKAASVKG